MEFELNQIFEGEYPPEAALWCNENNAYINEIEAIDGVRRFQIVAIPAPSPEEIEASIQKRLTDAVQYALDSFAQTRGYDGIMSACSYANSTDAQFKIEADYCITLRDETWRMGYAIVADVKAGLRPIPTIEELIDELPVGSAKWPDEVTA